VALVFQRGLSLWAFKSRKVEVLSQGDVSILLKDGRLLSDGMREALLSPEKIFASLRSKGVEHLGQVRRIYLEASGDLSLIKYRKPKPGLLIIPQYDLASGRYYKVPGHYACATCGNLVTADDPPAYACEFCGEEGWREAVIAAEALSEAEAR
jgi:Protein of unknown function (DUF421)